MRRLMPLLLTALVGCGGPVPGAIDSPSAAPTVAPSAAPRAEAPVGGGGGGEPVGTPAPTVEPTASPATTPTPVVGSGGDTAVTPTPAPTPTPTATASPTPTPTPDSTQAPNVLPVFESFKQSPKKIEVGARGTLSVTARDPDGDALSYTWSAEKGRIEGQGASVAYVPDREAQQPGRLNDVVTVSVSDGRGTPVSRTFAVDTFIGSLSELPASGALEWNPARTAAAELSGGVTIDATGDFSVYNTVIIEYSTGDGRRMALAGPGRTTLSGVNGWVYAYLLGPTGENTPTPEIRLTFTDDFGRSVERTVTEANVVGSQHAGTQLMSSPGHQGYVFGESTAKNGAFPYRTMLLVDSGGLINAPGQGDQGEITYSLVREGDQVWGIDFRISHGDSDKRVLMTDSLGGAADNTGSWQLFSLVFDE